MIEFERKDKAKDLANQHEQAARARMDAARAQKGRCENVL